MRKTKKKANNRLHKTLLSVILALAFGAVFSVDCMADSGDSAGEIGEDINRILEEFSLLMPEGDQDTDIGVITDKLGIKRILEGIANEVSGQSGEMVGFIMTLMGIVLLSSLAALTETEMGAFASRAVGAVASLLLFERLSFLVLGAVASLNEIGELFAAVIPVCLAVNSLGTSPTTATTQALGMGVTLSIYSYIASTLILPVVVAVFVTSALCSVDSLFGRIAKGVKSTFLWVMGIFTALVGATFSLQSIVAAGADSAALRSARYAISSTVPIVGNAVSGALGVLLSGASYARGVVGGGAIAVTVSLVLSPLVTLLLYRTCLKLGVFFSSVTSNDGVGSVISAFVGAMDVLIAAYTLTSAVYIAELVAFLKGGVGGA